MWCGGVVVWWCVVWCGVVACGVVRGAWCVVCVRGGGGGGSDGAVTTQCENSSEKQSTSTLARGSCSDPKCIGVGFSWSIRCTCTK